MHLAHEWVSSQHLSPQHSVVVVHDFAGEVRRKILAAKYRNERRYLREFAQDIASYLQRYDVTPQTVITWAPTSDARRRIRGVDQSEILARHVAAFLRLPTKRLLRKVTRIAQTGAPRVQRLSQVQFIARVPRHVTSVIVIDDVVTTGATMNAAVAALQNQGVRSVLCVAIAATR